MGEEETKFSSLEILEGIKTHDRIILKYVYDIYFPQVYKYIENRKGCESDAWDVFQDVMGVIYDYSQKPDFKLSVPFPQFFFSLTRNVWFGLLRKWKIGVDLVYDELQYLPDDDSEKLQEAIYNQVINRLTHKYLSQLDERCMLLIKFSALGIATASIAKKLNYHSNRAVYGHKNKM